MSVSVARKCVREEEEEEEAGGTRFFARNPALVWQLFTQRKTWLPLPVQSRLARTCKTLYGKCEQISEPFRFMVQLWRHLPPRVQHADRMYLVRRSGLLPCMKWAAAMDPPPKNNALLERTWLKDALDSGLGDAIMWVIHDLVDYTAGSRCGTLIKHCIDEMIRLAMPSTTIACITCHMMQRSGGGDRFHMNAVAAMMAAHQFDAAVYTVSETRMDWYQKYRDILLRLAVLSLPQDFPLFWESSAHQRFLELCPSPTLFAPKQAIRDCFSVMEKSPTFQHIALRCKQQILDYVDGRK
jgi:hypothetical protein